MLVTTVLGSPRRKGNTNRALSWVEEALELANHQVDRVNLYEYNIKGCKGCFACKRHPDRLGCQQKDDLEQVMNRLIEADLILYGSPIYFWGPTAQMKTLIDRHCCVVTGFNTPEWQSLAEGGKVGLVVTCEDEADNNADLIVTTFTRLRGIPEMRLRG